MYMYLYYFIQYPLQDQHQHHQHHNPLAPHSHPARTTTATTALPLIHPTTNPPSPRTTRAPHTSPPPNTESLTPAQRRITATMTRGAMSDPPDPPDTYGEHIQGDGILKSGI